MGKKKVPTSPPKKHTLRNVLSMVVLVAGVAALVKFLRREEEAYGSVLPDVRKTEGAGGGNNDTPGLPQHFAVMPAKDGKPARVVPVGERIQGSGPAPVVAPRGTHAQVS